MVSKDSIEEQMLDLLGFKSFMAAGILDHGEDVIFMGESRMKQLYRMGITRYLKEVKSDSQIFGEINKAWEDFEKDADYESFLVRRKNL